MKAFLSILDLADGPQKTACLAEWVQSLFPEEMKPTLVGGAALELYTGGAYTTGDLDFVGDIPAAIEKKLFSFNFERHGRHYIHTKGKVFLEFPATELDPGTETFVLNVSGKKVFLISPGALLLDRLSAWKFWRSELDGQNAFLLWKARKTDMTISRLNKQAKETDVLDALASLKQFFSRTKGAPSNQDMKRWARKWS